MNLDNNVRYVNWFIFQISVSLLEVPSLGLEQVPEVPAVLAPAWLCGVREKHPGRGNTIRVAQRNADIITGMEVFD